ncbi:nucleotidyltransferase domain-containing protein [Collinsella sp. AM33-4BH]|nr:nucleotidyltransferase domain-containing protein [Collinsella sp. AM33-4BH]
MISFDYISSAVSRVLAQYDVREAYLFGSFARGEQTPNSDIDLRLVCGNTMTFGTLYELSHELERELGERLISSPTHQSTCACPSAKVSSKMRCASMKQHVRDDEFANIILLSDPPVVLNVENLKAIRDGDALIATGKPSRSNAKIARHPIGGLLRAIQLYEQIRLDLRRASLSSALALAKTLNCAIEDPVRQPVALEYDSKPCSSETINSKNIAV